MSRADAHALDFHRLVALIDVSVHRRRHRAPDVNRCAARVLDEVIQDDVRADRRASGRAMLDSAPESGVRSVAVESVVDDGAVFRPARR